MARALLRRTPVASALEFNPINVIPQILQRPEARKRLLRLSGFVNFGRKKSTSMGAYVFAGLPTCQISALLRMHSCERDSVLALSTVAACSRHRLIRLAQEARCDQPRDPCEQGHKPYMCTCRAAGCADGLTSKPFRVCAQSFQPWCQAP